MPSDNASHLKKAEVELPGWWPAIKNLDEALRKIHPRYEILQIKEKLGGLRFYTGPLSETGRQLVRSAESICSTSCEICGKSAKLRKINEFCLRTLCDEHLEEPARA